MEANLTKTKSNSILLGLLTRRKAKSLNNINRNWPGKFAPTLLNMGLQRSQTKKVREVGLLKSEKKSKETSIMTMPLVKMSSASLSLIPTARSRTIISMQETWRTTKSKKKFYVSKEEKETVLERRQQPPIQFKNSIVSEMVNSESLSNFKKKSILDLVRKFEEQIEGKASILNDYIIDYKAFNYIEKVIDNPEKWGQFVHRKSSQDTSAVKSPQHNQ